MHSRRIFVSGSALAGLSALATMAMAQGPAPAPLMAHQMRPHVYWIEGGGGNSGVIVGNKGVIVIDAKTSAAYGKELLAEIAKITPKPVATVILTHSDGDHVNGLAAFPQGIKVIAHENNKAEQEKALAAGGRGAPPKDHLPTDVVTKEKESMKIDGVKFELYHWAPAHTSGDLVVFLPDDNIVFTGDLVATQLPDPLIHLAKNGSSEGWIKSVKEMVDLNADQFVPGHGTVQTKEQVEQRLKDAEVKREKIKEMVAKGKSLDEIRTALGEKPPAAGGRGPQFATYTTVVYQELTKKSS